MALFRIAFETYTGDGGYPALIHKGRKILVKSNLAPSTFIVVAAWKKHLSQSHSNTYAAEWEPGRTDTFSNSSLSSWLL